MVDISIITPCYNTGEYLIECVNSVLQYKGNHKFEIIVINDGSTDANTVTILGQISADPFIKIINHEANLGATAARNSGCKIAQGRHLLFLDSDNMIFPEYIDIGIKHLDSDSNLGVVYGKPTFIGDKSRKPFETGPFDIQHLLSFCYIDMCAVVRKEAWESINGFEEKLKAFQDWDLWLSLFEKSWDFKFIDKDLFIYRRRKDSISQNFSKNAHIRQEVYNMISNKHHRLYFDQYKALYNYMLINQLDFKIGSIILKLPRLFKSMLSRKSKKRLFSFLHF